MYIEKALGEKKELWLKIHLKSCLVVMLSTMILEFIGMFALKAMNYLLHTPSQYFIYYLLIPFGLELLGLIISLILLRVLKSFSMRAMVLCLFFSYQMFIIYTIHLQYNSLCIGFAVAIMVSIVYGDFMITTVTAAVSIALKIISDVFIVWDYSFTTNRIGTANEAMNFIMSLVVLILTYFTAVLISRIEKKKQEYAVEAEMEKIEFREASLTDELTGIGNRKAFRQKMDEIEPGTGFAILDVDYFKNVNDTYGHSKGDEYLIQLAEMMKQIPNAIPYRFGGDEFTLVFSELSTEEIKKLCLDLQKDFHEIRIPGCREDVSISIGITAFHENEEIADMIERADKALYNAKLERNKICTY